MSQTKYLNILLGSHISEKTAQSASNYPLHAFKVAKDATKPEIKYAVEKLFNVKVRHVRVCNTKGKPARFGRMQGRRKRWKKAYVTLQQGEELDIAQK